MHYKRKTDANQGMIARSLQWAGYHLTDLSGCGKGIPDLLCTRNGACFLVEIKNPKGRNTFTPAQTEYYRQVNAPVYVLRDIKGVELLINGDLKPINPRNIAINGKEKAKNPG